MTILKKNFDNQNVNFFDICKFCFQISVSVTNNYYILLYQLRIQCIDKLVTGRKHNYMYHIKITGEGKIRSPSKRGPTSSILEGAQVYHCRKSARRQIQDIFFLFFYLNFNIFIKVRSQLIFHLFQKSFSANEQTLKQIGSIDTASGYVRYCSVQTSFFLCSQKTQSIINHGCTMLYDRMLQKNSNKKGMSYGKTGLSYYLPFTF